jgi:hypothetical protein
LDRRVRAEQEARSIPEVRHVGPEEDRLRVERRLHHVVAADRHQASSDEDGVGDGVERRQLAHRVEQDHRGRGAGGDPAPSDDGEAATLGQGLDLVEPLGVARRQDEPEVVRRRPRRKERVEHDGFLTAVRAARHDDGRVAEV